MNEGVNSKDVHTPKSEYLISSQPEYLIREQAGDGTSEKKTKIQFNLS